MFANNESGIIHTITEISKIVKKARAITPVPGGVGPVTIACLLSNTLKAFKNIN